MNIVSNEDFQTIGQQLGRRPEGLQYVCVRDANKIPVVIKVAPIVKNKPFPSLYWLAHKELSKEIDHLESTGLIKELEEKIIPQDPVFLKQLIEAHQLYAQERYKELLKTPGYQQLPSSYIENLKTRGIGGLADFTRVRCLHMHYAHHLVSDNPVGQYLDQNFPRLREILA